MNVKINKSQFEYLNLYQIGKYLFGSQLHGIAKEGSDYDYVIVLNDILYKRFDTKAIYLPNFHSYQYDCEEENTQYVLMTETQFYRNLFSGDGNMIADIVLLNENHPDYENRMHLCRTYKVIKGYLGVAKRDLKMHGDNEKKRFHALRSLYMASSLIDRDPPSTLGIKVLTIGEIPTKEILFEREKVYRLLLNDRLNNGEIDLYPNFKEGNELIQIMTNSNNIREFKY